MAKMKTAPLCERTVLQGLSYPFSTQRTHILGGKTVRILAALWHCGMLHRTRGFER